MRHRVSAIISFLMWGGAFAGDSSIRRVPGRATQGRVGFEVSGIGFLLILGLGSGQLKGILDYTQFLPFPPSLSSFSSCNRPSFCGGGRHGGEEQEVSEYRQK